jgi:hypothetical protein
MAVGGVSSSTDIVAASSTPIAVYYNSIGIILWAK